MTSAPPRPSVTDVLLAIDSASLLPLLPAEEARLLAGPVARVAAGVDLPLEDQRSAARIIQAARAWLEGPLSSMGLTIPDAPEPVHRAPSQSRASGRAAEAKLIDGGQRIGVRNLYTAAPLVKQLPGAKPARKADWSVYTLPATPAAARALLDTLAPFGIRASRGVIALSDAHQEAQDARALLVDGAPLPDIDPASYGINASLWDHQHRGVAIGEASRATLFAIKMGGGKTISAIALANRVQAQTVMIVCPNRVRAVWTREVRERSSVGWHIEDGTRPPARRGARRQDLSHPDRLERAQRVLFDCDCGAPVHAFVLNYEALAQRVWQEWEPAQKLDMIIWDEAHRLKNHLTKVKKRKAKAGPREAALGPHATKEQILEARRLDAMGPRERQLRRECEPEEPPYKELHVARILDKAEHRKEEEFRASKLTVSGVAARWVEWSHRRVALTGTPFPQHPWDIFGLYRALDPGVFGQVWTPFKDKYLEMDRTGTYPKAIRADMLREFANLSMSLMYRPVVDLNLPPVTDVVRTVELEPAARKAYDQLDQELWTDLSRWLRGESAEREPSDELDGPAELTASNVLSRLLRLQQLTGGTLRTDPVKAPDGRLMPGPEARVSRAKTDALAEFEGGALTGGILDEIGCTPKNPGGPEPVIVFCRFKSDLDAVREIAEKAGLRYGEVSGRRGDGLNADARMNEDIDICAVQIQAGGTGVDLTRARYAIWYSLGYSVSDYDQARARPYRPGQTRPMVFIHLLAEDTADQAVYEAIKARKAAVAAVFQAAGVDLEEAGLGSLVENVSGDPTSPGSSTVDSSAAAVRMPWE